MARPAPLHRAQAMLLVLPLYCLMACGAAVASSGLSLGEVQAAVVAPDGSKMVSSKGAYPAKLLSSPQLPPRHTLEVSGTVQNDGQAFTPRQCFLVLLHKATGAAAYLPGKLKKGSTYAFSASFADVEKQAGGQAGEYDVQLLVGDPSVAKGLQWVLGAIELVAPNGAAATPAAWRTASSQPVTNQKPVITHLFRLPDRRPPATVSLVFTGLAFVPLAVVLLYVSSGLKLNFNAWPKDSSTALAAMLFHGLLLAVLLLDLQFWLSWNLAQTLPVALGLGALLTVVGHKALSGLATERLASKKD